VLDGTIKIKRLNPEQIRRFVEEYAAHLAIRGEKVDKIRWLTTQLGDFASWPGGLEYLCRHPEPEQGVEVILNYISDTAAEHGRPFRLFDDLLALNPVAASDSALFKTMGRLLNANLPNQPDIRLGDTPCFSIQHTIDRMSLTPEVGAQIKRGVGEALQAGILVPDDTVADCYRFIAEEVGYFFLAALRLLDSNWSDLRSAQRQFLQNPSSRHAQYCFQLALWRAKQLLLQNDRPK